MKKAIFIGLIVGILFSVISIMGISYCEWNPAHYIDKGPICKMASIFYWPIIPQSLVFYSIVQVDGTGTTVAFLVMSLITIVEFILLAMIISWVYSKLKKV